jgi:hypothetical protein
VTIAACPDAEAIARDQFRVFDRIGNEITLGDEARQRMLRLSARQWLAWARLRNGGPVPNEPVLPVMLRRLGAASYRLAVAPERIGEAGSTQATVWAAAA